MSQAANVAQPGSAECRHLLPQHPEREIDRPPVGPERQRRHAERETAVEQRRGEEHPPSRRSAVHDGLVEPIWPPSSVAARRRPAIGHDRQIRRRSDLEAGRLRSPRGSSGPAAASPRARRGTAGCRAGSSGSHMRSARKCLDSSGERSAGEISPGSRSGVLHVVAPNSRGPPRAARHPAPHDAGAVREEQALVRVEHDRIGPLDARGAPRGRVGQQEESAIRRVHVEPAAAPAPRSSRSRRADPPRRCRWCPRPRSRARAGARARGRPAMASRQRVGPHAEPLVHRAPGGPAPRRARRCGAPSRCSGAPGWSGRRRRTA